MSVSQFCDALADPSHLWRLDMGRGDWAGLRLDGGGSGRATHRNQPSGGRKSWTRTCPCVCVYIYVCVYVCYRRVQLRRCQARREGARSLVWDRDRDRDALPQRCG